MPDKYICFNPKFHLLDLILRFSWTLSRKEEGERILNGKNTLNSSLLAIYVLPVSNI